MLSIKEFININQKRIIEELFSLLRIPSVSAHKQAEDAIYLCAAQWMELLLKSGMETARIISTKGNPVVYAEKIVHPAKPTVLVYGHYDVMPAEPLNLWDSPPFEPEIRDEKIFARGADDDKGQSFMHAKAIEYLVKNNLLNCNVKFLIEGEEEIGSPALEAFCEENKELLKCDTILVSDTSMLAADTPSITTGLRGLAYWQLEMTGANRDLHSGIFGGAVANPLNEMCKLLASLTDMDGKITVPHFYDKVQDITEEEKALIAQIPLDEALYMKNLGVTSLYGEKGFSTLERTGIRPTLDICGIWGGYTGEGSKTVLPSKAYAKLSSRLVPNQKYQEIMDLVTAHLLSVAPKHITLKVTPLHGAESYVCPINTPAYRAAEKAYQEVFGVRPLPVRRGGSIGVIPVFEKVLKVKPILMGFGLESDAIHSPNENFPLEMFKKGITTIVAFYDHYEKLRK
jgi:acetylornithine deacetylase/succinyl-diaminopimelate desuccinylase-like protein